MIVLDRASIRKHDLHQVRLVGDGENKIVSVQSAYSLAEEQGLDLVLIAQSTQPPVVKIQDFRKIEYEKKKARKAQKKASSQGNLKEIQLRIHISSHDLATKVSRGRGFLSRGDKVKLLVQLRGRERDYADKAWRLLEEFAASVGPCKVFMGKGPMVTCMLEPEKVTKPGKKSGKATTTPSQSAAAGSADAVKAEGTSAQVVEASEPASSKEGSA